MNKLPKPTLRIAYTCVSCCSPNLDPITETHVHCDNCGQSMESTKKEYDEIFSFWMERKLRNPGVLKNLRK